jgi:hypothetical protein
VLSIPFAKSWLTFVLKRRGSSVPKLHPRQSVLPTKCLLLLLPMLAS